MKQHTLLLAPAIIVAGLAATPSRAHAPVVTATVDVPAVTVGVGGVVVTVGHPAPPPVVYVPPPAPRVVYVEPAPPPSVVYVHPREERVVYLEDDHRGCRHPKGTAHGYWKKHHKHDHVVYVR